MTRALNIALCAVALTGCSLAAGPDPIHLCQSDFECASNEVCFPLQGCGDPGGGLVVEVQGNTRMGQLAQDFAISDGGFKSVNDFELLPATLVGEFVRDSLIYPSAVTVRLRGESALIPGVVRSYQETFTKPERGAYTLPVGAGTYTAIAETADQAIPPAVSAVNVTLGSRSNVSFTFSPTEKTITVTGRLLKRTEPGPTPETPIEIPVGQPMDVQAFAPVTQRPLSQKVAVKSDGTFFLFVSAEALALGSFVVTATPHLAGALVPSKSFTLELPLGPVIRLVLGDFGDQLPSVDGFVKTSAGTPVKDATVYVEGPVNGGGTFRSQVVTTDVNGAFSLNLLPSLPTGSLLLTALPPPSSPAGVVQRPVKTAFRAGPIPDPYLDVTGGKSDDPATWTVTCPDKITVVGTLVRPPVNGASGPAIGVGVVAHAVEKLKELDLQPLPMGETVATTDENGRFSLELDPGVYEIDFIPGEDLPRTSRVVTVRADNSAPADGGMASKAIDLKETELRKGRKVTGKVTVPNAMTGVIEIAPNAIIRYFRVSGVGGTNVSLLLAEALTDAEGNYSVMLPAK